MKRLLSAFIRRPSGVIGLVILVTVLGAALLAPWLYPGSPWDTVATPFSPPGAEGMLMGSDSLGRDVAAGIVHGAKVSLMIGVASTFVALVIGVLVGAIAGYAGGRVSSALMGFTELFQAVPAFVLAILFVAILTPSVTTITVAIAIVSWPQVARLTRGEFLSIKEREYVQAARCAGEGPVSIVWRHILPNALSPIIVTGSLSIATAILIESALSFMGLGDPNLISWGYMVGTARTMIRQAWWMSFFPGMAILLTVLAINLVGEALNDVLNPRVSRQ
ncbi:MULTISPECIES: ABC transporter permease [unclassified Variovorax]|uniref:ABC transporter permease n=1 Tax=unclassified Variovorax TaxID=663243 RepID=UPI001317E0D9|nr:MULTISPECIES: ABC transporter permease [unclassified Variovorax]VTU14898.1 Dipeptide transport system permease protein DppC [Variovorax sp. SRS16]VTU22314.1 Dipeptide transport system permease protein DppC [Variovorax sp. PBL-E5]